MYKIATQLTNKRLILIRKTAGDGPCSLLLFGKQPERSYAIAEPPRPIQSEGPRKKSHKLLWGTIGATLLTGAAVVYAKENPDLRDWLTLNAPWADDFIALIYQEQNSLGQWSSKQWNNTTSAVSDLVFGKPESTVAEHTKHRAEQNLNEKPKVAATYDLPKPALAPHYAPEQEIERAPEVVKEPTASKPELPSVAISKDLVSLEHNIHELTKTAVENYKKATAACVAYNKALQIVVESSVNDLDMRKLAKFRSAKVERDNAAKAAKEAAENATQLMEDLSNRVDSGLQAPPEAINATKKHVLKFRSDIAMAKNEFENEVQRSYIADKYWQKVEEARKRYAEELETLFPGVDLTTKKLNLPAEAADLLLIHTVRQVQYLQNELAEAQTLRDLRLKRAIESRDDKELIHAKAEELYQKEKMELEKEFLKKILQIQSENEKITKDQLRRQMEAYEEQIQIKLQKKEQEVTSKMNRTLSESIEKERVQFKAQLAEVTGKLQGIEATLNARAQSDAMARRSQSLWAAGEALLAATRKTVPETRVDIEIKAIEKAAGDDKLVKTVINGIPQDVKEKGIVTEQSLKEKFDKMEKTALRVALVSKDGSSLFVYLLSWLQSILLFSRVGNIPKNELENQPTDFSKMDTFDIMQRARYWVERGDIASALRYVNLLEGASRAAADSWCDAARRFLETRQAAETVMAHAAASSLLYL